VKRDILIGCHQPELSQMSHLNYSIGRWDRVLDALLVRLPRQAIKNDQLLPGASHGKSIRYRGALFSRDLSLSLSLAGAAQEGERTDGGYYSS
jgi:hypothetical protein